jgi:hypothetical protein
MLTITRYIGIPAEQKLCTYFDDDERGASNLYAELSTADGLLAKPDWTDADHREALAAKLRVERAERYATVDAADIEIAPVPPTPEPEREPEVDVVAEEVIEPRVR